MRKLMIRASTLLLVVPLVVAAQDSKLDSAVIRRASAVSVSQLDPKLPQMRFGDWLKMEAGAGATINWETNDCGEQTGDPATNPKEVPLCAEATAKMRDGRTIVVRLAVGTSKKGLVSKPEVSWITVGWDPNSDKPLAHLSDVPLELTKYQQQRGLKPQI